MAIQDCRDNIYHNYGVDVSALDVNELRELASELDYLADERERLETQIQEMRVDLIKNLHLLDKKYQDQGLTGTISINGTELRYITDTDIDYEE